MKELITYLLLTIFGFGQIDLPVSQNPVLEKIDSVVETEAVPDNNSAHNNLSGNLTPTSIPSVEQNINLPQKSDAYNQSSEKVLPAQIPQNAIDNSPSLVNCKEHCPPKLTPTPTPTSPVTPTLTPTPTPRENPPVDPVITIPELPRDPICPSPPSYLSAGDYHRPNLIYCLDSAI